ncbi:metallophosphoesterase [Candidatus Uabimicrobium sp. HlEnr_7]|uniref:metallophosphoesterase family protein n=1 Tax=Candidatus Uabimicrobium helgolandensis TaxID=3095367 RepID=UPI003555F3C3
MLKALWLTDIHLEFLEDDLLQKFIVETKQYDFDMIWITGDISHGPHLSPHLISLANSFQKPIYFVLGNHDFYGQKMIDVYGDMATITTNPNLTYLSTSSGIHLNDNNVLIGHDSWGDGRYGNYYQSEIVLNDFFAIRDFVGLSKENILQKMQDIVSKATIHTEKVLNKALQTYEHVWMLTHVPPFKEASLYGEVIADDNWLPFFSCKQMGDMLKEVMRKHSKQKLTVLCGHTHNKADIQVCENLRVYVGGAEYCKPCVQRIFDI